MENWEKSQIELGLELFESGEVLRCRAHVWIFFHHNTPARDFFWGSLELSLTQTEQTVSLNLHEWIDKENDVHF